MSNPLVIIDATQPVNVVALEGDETVLNNSMWKFCEDDVMADTPTYDLFDYAPDTILPKGTVVRITHLWGWLEDGNLSEPTDYQVTVTKDAPVSRALHVLYSRYYEDMIKMEASPRDFLFIEQVSTNGDHLSIAWGT